MLKDQLFVVLNYQIGDFGEDNWIQQNLRPALALEILENGLLEIGIVSRDLAKVLPVALDYAFFEHYS